MKIKKVDKTRNALNTIIADNYVDGDNIDAVWQKIKKVCTGYGAEIIFKREISSFINSQKGV